MGSGSNRIVVDWDGTCVEEKWPEQDGYWLPGSIESLQKMLDGGYEVVILSARIAGVDLDEKTPLSNALEIASMRKRLNDAGLSKVNIWTKPWKPRALAYIDDRAIRFNGDWEEVMKEINKLKVVT